MMNMDRRQFLSGLGASLAAAILRIKQGGAAPERDLLFDNEGFEAADDWSDWEETPGPRSEPIAFRLVLEHVMPWGLEYGGAGTIAPWTFMLWTDERFVLDELFPVEVEAMGIRCVGMARVASIAHDMDRDCSVVTFVGTEPLTMHVEC